jgi:hypothetical protein
MTNFGKDKKHCVKQRGGWTGAERSRDCPAQDRASVLVHTAQYHTKPSMKSEKNGFVAEALKPPTATLKDLPLHLRKWPFMLLTPILAGSPEVKDQRKMSMRFRTFLSKVQLVCKFNTKLIQWWVGGCMCWGGPEMSVVMMVIFSVF